jgi:hypothetical protein
MCGIVGKEKGCIFAAAKRGSSDAGMGGGVH